MKIGGKLDTANFALSIFPPVFMKLCKFDELRMPNFCHFWVRVATNWAFPGNFQYPPTHPGLEPSLVVRKVDSQQQSTIADNHKDYGGNFLCMV